MNPWKIIKSVLSALLGVRPSSSAEEDFSQKKLWPYLLVGALFIILFVGILVVVVQWVVHSAV